MYDRCIRCTHAAISAQEKPRFPIYIVQTFVVHRLDFSYILHTPQLYIFPLRNMEIFFCPFFPLFAVAPILLAMLHTLLIFAVVFFQFFFSAVQTNVPLCFGSLKMRRLLGRLGMSLFPPSWRALVVWIVICAMLCASASSARSRESEKKALTSIGNNAVQRQQRKIHIFLLMPDTSCGTLIDLI